MPTFTDQFKKIIKRLKVGFSMDIMQQSAFLVINPALAPL